MNEQELATLIAEGEHEGIDFKRELRLKTKEDKGEFVKDVISIANSALNNTGYLIVGVKDDGTTVGTNKLHEGQMQSIVDTYIQPAVVVRCLDVPMQVPGCSLVEVIEIEGTDKPYKVARDIGNSKQNDVFVRHGSYVRSASPEEILKMAKRSAWFWILTVGTSLIAIASMVWIITEPGFESLIAVIGSVLAITAYFGLRKFKYRKTADLIAAALLIAVVLLLTGSLIRRRSRPAPIVDDEQVRVLLESIATFQAIGVDTGPTATAVAGEVASLTGTLQTLKTERSGLETAPNSDAQSAVPSTPTPMPTETPQPTSTPTCPAVTGPFAEVWQSVRGAIGCASDQVTTGLIAEENFEGGKMLWREPVDWAQALVLFDDGTWQVVEHEPYDDNRPEFSCPDANTPSECPPTPRRGFGMIWCDRPQIRNRLGNATDCERGYQGSMQQFEQGFTLLSDSGAILVLYDDGYWEHYLSGPFGSMWSDMQDKIGCATDAYSTTWVAEEAFQNGWMLWREDNDKIYVVYDWGSWETYPNMWRNGDPYFSCPDADTPDESPPTPVMGFGKTWCTYPDLRQRLGWAIKAEDGFDATVQDFERGFMLRSDRWTWAFYDDDSWERRNAPSNLPPDVEEIDIASTFIAAWSAVPVNCVASDPEGDDLTYTWEASDGFVVGEAGSVVYNAPDIVGRQIITVGVQDEYGHETIRPIRVQIIPADPPPGASEPIGVFGQIWHEYLESRRKLGWAMGEEGTTFAAQQSFDRGVMFWREDTDEIYVLMQGGNWQRYIDTWEEGMEKYLCASDDVPKDTPPTPRRGIGKLWCDRLGGPDAAIGWATTDEKGYDGRWQAFEHGLIWKGCDERIYVFCEDKSWQSYPSPNNGGPASCPGASQQRIRVGDRAQVCTAYDRLALRSQPQDNGSEITRLEPGEYINIVDGPACIDGCTWWKVQTDSGAVGWVAEGGDDIDPYFVCRVD